MKIIDPRDWNGGELVAVDIGNKGGFCVVHRVGMGGFLLRPVKSKFEDECVYFLSRFTHRHTGCVVAENVHTFGGQGIVSNGTLMENKGILKGVCAAYGLQIHWIEPRAWQACYTIKKRDNFKNKDQFKKHLKEIAEKNIPSYEGELNSGTADAWLMWNYYASIIVNDRMRPLGELQFS